MKETMNELALQARFRSRLPLRYQRLSEACVSLCSQGTVSPVSSVAETYTQLYTELHNLKGAAATYGLQRLAAEAATAEALMVALLDASELPCDSSFGAAALNRQHQVKRVYLVVQRLLTLIQREAAIADKSDEGE